MKDYTDGKLQKDLESIDRFYTKNPELNVISKQEQSAPQTWIERFDEVFREYSFQKPPLGGGFESDIKIFIAAEIKTAQEEMVREILDYVPMCDDVGFEGIYVSYIKDVAKKYGLNISDKKE